MEEQRVGKDFSGLFFYSALIILYSYERNTERTREQRLAHMNTK